MITISRPRRGRPDIEWPTIALAVAIYGTWLAATWWHALLPWYLLAPLGGWLIAWHGSLQHETIHGHPTRNSAINGLLGGIPLSLWLPYGHYRRTHGEHHATHAVTDPFHDPEARYLVAGTGIAYRMRRLGAGLEATLIGRLTLGPALAVSRFLVMELRVLVGSPRRFAQDWVPHALALCPVLAWLALCRLPLLEYVLLFVYPGTALSLLRSYAEHRAAAEPGHRVAIVEDRGPLALLFLNNNLHAAHHAAPGLAWYRLPDHYRRHRDAILAANGELLYRGYRDVARRFLFAAHDHPVHPGHRAGVASSG